MGFFSRYAVHRCTYPSPVTDPGNHIEALVGVLRTTRPALVVPSVETSLVALNDARSIIERYAPVAAAPPETLEFALDKRRTVALAASLGVPVPRTVHAPTVDMLLAGAMSLRFPVAVKPCGPRLHRTTRHDLTFKVRYAATLDELAVIVRAVGNDDVASLLVQEYAEGTGRCVAAVCRHGRPVSLFAYARDREFPVSGGVSVMRTSIALDDRLRQYTLALLGSIGWHGIAMVEFKYDRAADCYSLMEINGRFQASTSLALDAGVNLPWHTAGVFLNHPARPALEYTRGTTERWLRGDAMALADEVSQCIRDIPSRHAITRMVCAVLRFIVDFRPGKHYDEFSLTDPLPALVELIGLLRLALQWTARAISALTRHAGTGRSDSRLVRALTRFSAQRSIRA